MPIIAGILVLALMVAMIVLARREYRRFGRWLRTLLTGLAVTGMVMLAGIVISPTILRTWTDPLKPNCAVYVDGSRSMLFKDSYSGGAAEWIRARSPHAVDADGKIARDAVTRAVLTPGAGT